MAACRSMGDEVCKSRQSGCILTGFEIQGAEGQARGDRDLHFKHPPFAQQPPLPGIITVGHVFLYETGHRKE